MSEFVRSLCRIAIPVTLQSMLQASFSIIDQIMIGQLGETNISAVGLCGNYSLIFSVLIGAVSTVAGILIAQFIGAEDGKEAWCSFWVSLIVGIWIASVFLTASGFLSSEILGFYTKDSDIINAGAVYFQIVAFTYIPMAVSNILSAWLRCKEHAAIPFLASLGAVAVNTGLNYVLIFGKAGFAAMGIKGAATATLVSQLFNMLFIFIGFVISIKKDEDKLVLSLHFEKITRWEYFIMIMPILISEFLWSLGQNVESAVYGHLGTTNLAAYTLTCPIQSLIVGALSGLSAAAGVMVGKRLGKKEYDDAYMEARKIMYAGLTGSVFCIGAAYTSGGSIYRIVSRRSECKGTWKNPACCFCIVCPCQSRKYDSRRRHHKKRRQYQDYYDHRYCRNLVYRNSTVHSCSVCVPMGDCRCLYITYRGGNFQADRITCYFQETKMDDQFIITNRRGVENGKGCPDVTLLLDPIAKVFSMSVAELLSLV